MQEIDFENGKTSISAETFKAFQTNVKNAFKNYQIGELTINTEIVKNGSLTNVNLTKDENNTVNLSLLWNVDPDMTISSGADYYVAYLPQEFRPEQNYVYGGARGEDANGPASFVVAKNDGRIVLTAFQNSNKIAMSCSFKAQGGIEV